MRFSIAAVVAALAAGVLGQQGYGLSSSTSSSTPIQYTTDVVSVYVTYCPEATTLTVGGSTYVVTTPTSITLTGSTYTVQTPVYTSTTVICNSCSSVPVPSSALPVVAPLYPSGPAGSPVPSGSPVGSSSPSNTIPVGSSPQFTGAAPRAVVGAGAGLAGILGLALLL
jgi:hypothetical protein